MASITSERGAPKRLGATPTAEGTHFAVVSDNAERIEICLFDEAGTRETERLALPGQDGSVRYGFVPGLPVGARYGIRAHGPYQPEAGHRFDAAKLLADPYATRLDRPFLFHPCLKAPAEARFDTAPFVPKAIVTDLSRDAVPMASGGPGFTYEVLVRAFSQNHPEIPDRFRGTLAALTQKPLLDHLTRIGVETVELMPLAAAIDEEHLARLGLTNSWGYNPITHIALDPRLAPGGLSDLRLVVDALHRRGIRVLLDVVLNHSGEGDEDGPTLCYRGLDNALYYAHESGAPGRLVNDTGCGNTFAGWRESVRRLFLDTLRTLVEASGVDGFRYDLGPVLGRGPEGFDPKAPFFRAVERDPVLKKRIHVAESWDVGPGGYQVGKFPPSWHEWQDRYRDDVRRFWRGDDGAVADLATRLAGSADIFRASRKAPSASINFVAAHDGFALADLTAYADKHNEANGEDNQDGHDENFSWNNGVEGHTDDPAILAARNRDVRALLATLFVSRGTPMLVAGDEFARTQNGNNNAYCQDNSTSWLDWKNADDELIEFTARLSKLRRDHPALSADAFLDDATGNAPTGGVLWLREDGARMRKADWHDPARRFLGLCLIAPDPGREQVLVYLNAAAADISVRLPRARPGHRFQLALRSERTEGSTPIAADTKDVCVSARSVVILFEVGARPNPDTCGVEGATPG